MSVDIAEFLTARLDRIELGASQDDAEFSRSPISLYVLANITASRAIVAEVERWTHDYNDDDQYFSCSQAVSTWMDDKSPGSGCADDDRRGKPCDCGLDRRRMAILGPLARIFPGHPDFDPAWNATPLRARLDPEVTK